MRHDRGQTVEEFVSGDDRFPPAPPRRSFGRCLVNGCRRWATTDERLCAVCRRRWRKNPPDRRPSFEQFIADGPWRPELDGRRAVMPEVPELVEWQLLAGLQPRRAVCTDHPAGQARDGVGNVARSGAQSVVDMTRVPGTYQSQRVVEVAMIAARRLTSTPEEERLKDAWDLGVFGIREHRRIDFTHIRQRWLREAAKGWTIERMATVRTQAAQQDVRFLGHLSHYLHAREDRGEEPSALTREDMTGFLSWLQSRVPAENRRHIVVSSTRRAVQFARRHLTGPGQPAAGIGGGFQLYHEDLPAGRARPRRARPGAPARRAGPAARRRAARPARRPVSGVPARVELIAHTGRRPGEICGLHRRVSALRRGTRAGWRQAATSGVALSAREAACQVGEPADQPGRRGPD